MSRRLVAIAALFLAAVTTGSAHAQSWTKDTFLRANLHGDETATGIVRWIERRNWSGPVEILLVNIRNAEALTTYEVDVDGDTVGTIQTNLLGNGVLFLRNPDIDEPRRYSTVSVGPMTGVFFDYHRLAPRGIPQRFIAHNGAIADGLTVHARYMERLRKRNIVRSFVVTVNGNFDERLDVRINGRAVGYIDPPEGDFDLGPDSSPRSGPTRPPNDGLPLGRNGKLSLRTDRTIHPSDTITIPIERWFPSLHPGDVVTVGPASMVIFRVHWAPPVL